VGYQQCLSILNQEGNSFYRTTNRWQPRDLIPDPYRRNLLKDAQQRLKALETAENEFQTLDRATLYINALKRMRLSVRMAQFSWRTDDLKFIRAISEFLSDYGTVIRYLKIDQDRGQFSDA
jgi:hypothetical protein